MRETSKAKQAWLDYLSFGPERSLEKLLAQYQAGTKKAPVKKLRTLKEWSRVFGWQQRLTDIAEQERAAIVARGIADKQNRVDALNERWDLMKQVVTARASDLATVPGGATGLLVRQIKSVGYGKEAEIVEEYAVDTGLLKELRAHEEQAAKELGQWTEKKEVTGRVKLDALSDEELALLEQIVRKTTDTG